MKAERAAPRRSQFFFGCWLVLFRCRACFGRSTQEFSFRHLRLRARAEGRGSRTMGSDGEPSRNIRAELLAPPRRTKPRTEKEAGSYPVGPTSVKQPLGVVCLCAL